jgi:hypothetical protein
MPWFKSKREHDLESLVSGLKEQIAHLEKPVIDAGAFIPVAIPQPNDMPEYERNCTTLTENSFLLFYFMQLRKRIMDEFIAGGRDAEYYSGKLAAISEILNDSRLARMQLEIRAQGGAI